MSHQTTKTPLLADEKTEVIAHLNDEHQDDLIDFAQLYFQSIANADDIAIDIINIIDIYHEGVELDIKIKNRKEQTLAFIPFPEPIQSLEELQLQYIALMQKSAKVQGKETIKITEQSFEIIDSYKISESMMRLVLSAENKSPYQQHQQAGYNYLFDCKSSEMTEDSNPIATQRYYTVRKSWQNNESIDGDANLDTAITKLWVDVYLHGDTTGGNWARRLKPKDIIISKREFPEKLAHLTTGQALLIADETSLPTIARLLEVWQNPVAPIVISITNEPAEQQYLQTLSLSETTHHPVILPMVIHHEQINLVEKISVLIDEFIHTKDIKIDKVWGGLEASVVKQLKKRLSNKLNIPRQDCVLKVYWRK